MFIKKMKASIYLSVLIIFRLRNKVETFPCKKIAINLKRHVQKNACRHPQEPAAAAGSEDFVPLR